MVRYPGMGLLAAGLAGFYLSRPPTIRYDRFGQITEGLSKPQVETLLGVRLGVYVSWRFLKLDPEGVDLPLPTAASRES